MPIKLILSNLFRDKLIIYHIINQFCVCVCIVWWDNTWNLNLKLNKTMQKQNTKDDKRRATINSHRETTDLSTNHLINASSGIITNRLKRMAQPRIIRVRANTLPGHRSSSSIDSSWPDPSFGLSSFGLAYDSSTLHSATAIETTTRRRKVKGFRFDSATLPGSKSSRYIFISLCRLSAHNCTNCLGNYARERYSNKN